MIDHGIFHDSQFQSMSQDFLLECGRLICAARGRPDFMAQMSYFPFFGEPTANDGTYAAIKNGIPLEDAAVGNVFLHAVSSILGMKKGKIFGGLFLSPDEKQLLPQFEDVAQNMKHTFDRIKGLYDWNKFLLDKIEFAETIAGNSTSAAQANQSDVSVINCPNCAQSVRVPSGKSLRIKCPKCETQWSERT